MPDNCERLRSSWRPINANLGISLRRTDQGYFTSPKMPNGANPLPEARFLLPRIPSSLLERSCGLLRSFWRDHQRCMSLLLYLDIHSRAWSALVPPQLSASSDSRAFCDFRGFEPPAAHLRLAGSIRSFSDAMDDDMTSDVAPIAGMHFSLDVHQSWYALHVHLCVDSSIFEANVDDVVAYDYQADMSNILPRIQLIDAL